MKINVETEKIYSSGKDFWKGLNPWFIGTLGVSLISAFCGTLYYDKAETLRKDASRTLDILKNEKVSIGRYGMSDGRYILNARTRNNEYYTELNFTRTEDGKLCLHVAKQRVGLFNAYFGRDGRLSFEDHQAIQSSYPVKERRSMHKVKQEYKQLFNKLESLDDTVKNEFGLKMTNVNLFTNI